MAKRKKKSGTKKPGKRHSARRAKRSPAQRAATRRMLAANKSKHGGKKTAHKGKRGKARRAKKHSGPTKFQRFLLRDPAAAKKKMGW